MAIDNKEQTPVVVEDPMSKHLQKKSFDPDWEYFGLKKKDVSSQITSDLFNGWEFLLFTFRKLFTNEKLRLKKILWDPWQFFRWLLWNEN